MSDSPVIFAVYVLVTVIFCYMTVKSNKAEGAIFRIPKKLPLAVCLELFIISGVNVLLADFSSNQIDVLKIGLYLLAAICEEIIFRGFLFMAELNILKLKPVVAAFLNALVFGLLHFFNLPSEGFFETLFQVICSFAAGFGFCAATFYTGSILPAMILHVLVNVTGIFVIQTLSRTDRIVFSAISVVIFISGVMCIRRKEKNEILY